MDMKWLVRMAGQTAVYGTLLILSACGGGTGSGGSSSVPAAPQTTFTLSTPTLTASARLNRGAATGVFSVTVQNAPDAGVYYKIAYSLNGVASGGVTAYASGNTLQVQVAFQSPASLGIGTYSDIIRVSLCYDSACTQLVSGSPQEITVRYSVISLDATISVSQASINLSSFITETIASSGSLYASLENMPIAPGYYQVTNSSSGIDHMDRFGSTGSGWVYVYPKTPATLGPGTYSDTITITACWDAACTIPLANSPLTVPVTYTVNDTITGVNGYNAKVISNLTAKAISVNRVNADLYLGVSATSPTLANSLAALVPNTGIIRKSIVVGSEPSLVDVADDGSYAYVGFSNANIIKRYSISSLTLDTTISLGIDPGFNSPRYAKDLQVAPGQSHRVAITRGISGYTANDLVIYDDTIESASYIDSYNSMDDIEWGATASKIFGGDTLTSAGKLFEFNVTANSITKVSDTASIEPDGIHFAGGLIYTDQGGIFDPATRTVLGAFSSSNVMGLSNAAIDTQLNRAYFLTSAGVEVRIYDLSTRVLLRTARLPGIYGPSRSAKLLRWGTNGLAFIDDNGRVILISGPFVTN